MSLIRTKQGLSKIGNGLLQMVGFPSSNKKQLVKKVFAKQIDGSKIIWLGIQEMFGKSPEQLRIKELESYLVGIKDTYGDSKYRLTRALVNNQLQYNRQWVPNTGTTKAIPPTKVLVELAKRFAVHTIAGDLVGIQPMEGPVSLGYFLRLAPPANPEQPSRHGNFEIVSQPIEACSRRLGVRWSIEACEDAAASSEDKTLLEDAILDVLSDEFINEFENEIVSTLSVLAIDEPTQSYTLALEIYRRATQMSTLHRRGAGNVVVLSPSSLTLLMADPTVTFVPSSVQFKSGTLYKCGIVTINGLDFTTIMTTDPTWSNQVLVAYKGKDGETDCGVMFCPYIVAMSAGVIVDLDTFNPMVAFMTRYGKGLNKNAEQYYAKFTHAYDKTYDKTFDLTAPMAITLTNAPPVETVITTTPPPAEPYTISPAYDE